jgi:NAD(P)-dependent dehydrogenase (short-subunit alcohol dehydrogenase family)
LTTIDSDRLTPRVWLITGTSSGFGRALAESALAAGDRVVATARHPEAVFDLADKYPEQAEAVRLDMTETSGLTELVDDIAARLGSIDVLVNNAGHGLVGAAEENTDQELRELMEVHLFGPAALVRAVLPHMRYQRSGAIVQFSSVGGTTSFPGISAYSATKFALEGLSESLAPELAPFGIRVMIVEPGAFRTGFNGPSALHQADPIADYDDVVGPVRDSLIGVDGHQPGDPVRLAEAIMQALAAPNPPLRLALGSDAFETIRGQVEARHAELLAWESLSRSTDFGV